MEIVKCTPLEVEKLMAIFRRRFFGFVESWSLEKIEVQTIIPLCKHVYSKRLCYAKLILQSNIDNLVPPFYPFKVIADATTRIVVPPIIEKRNNGNYLCDGMHRVFASKLFGIEQIFALIAHNCTLPLPGKPQTWATITEESLQLPVEQNFEAFNREWLTGYSKFCNSDYFVGW